MIFGAIAIAWLAYLVPHFVRGREGEEQVDAVDPADRFADSMRIVRHGTAPLLDQDLERIGAYQVSTPQTRRAAVNDLRRLERLAATRRRRVLLVLLAALSVVIGVYGVDLLPWWSMAVPGGLLVAFVVVARLSVRRMRADLDRRYREVCQGSDESTVFLSRRDVLAAAGGSAAEAATEPTIRPGGLWDPVPITMPTYVSKPLAPRTVRTIDLSGPGATTHGRTALPVTADAPVAAATSAGTDHGDAREAASA